MLQTVNYRTFDNYVENVVMVYIKNRLHSVDIVWNQYFSGSLKEKVRNDRETGVYRKVNQTVICQMTGLPFLDAVKIKLNYLNFIQRN